MNLIPQSLRQFYNSSFPITPTGFDNCPIGYASMDENTCNKQPCFSKSF